MSKFTVKEIKEHLDQENIKYTSKMSKQQLLDLLPTGNPMPKEMPKEMPKDEPNVLISQKHFRFNPVTENVEPVVQQKAMKDVIDIVFNEACKKNASRCKKPEKSKRQRKVKEEEVKEEVKEEDVTPELRSVTPKNSSSSSLWVSTLKEYNKDKKYKIHKKDSDEYKEILDLYNKKKTSKQV